MQPTISYWLGLFSVIFLMVGIGVYAARKVADSNDFSLAGRSSGTMMVMGTIIGTIVGASSTVGTAQLAFKTGVSSWWFCLGSSIALIIMGFFYSKPLHESGKSTVSQFLTAAYDRRTGMFTGVFSVVGIFFSAASTFLVLIPMLSNCFGITAVYSAITAFCLTICYVFFGGVKATGLVGIFKALLLYSVLLVVLAKSLFLTGGGVDLWNEYSYFPWFDMFARGFWVDIASGASTVVGVMTTQTYIQAMCSAKNAQKARDGIFLSGILTALSGVPAILVGMYMRSHHPEISPIDALPLFITTYLPDWFAGVSIGMLIIASLGTSAGLALGMATIISSDLFGAFFPGLYNNNKLLVTRAAVFLISMLLVVFTYMNMGALVLDWTVLSMCIRGAGVFVPFVMAIYAPGRFASRYATLAVAGGSLAALTWQIFLPAVFSPLYPGMLVSCLFMFFGYKKTVRSENI